MDMERGLVWFIHLSSSCYFCKVKTSFFGGVELANWETGPLTPWTRLRAPVCSALLYLFELSILSVFASDWTWLPAVVGLSFSFVKFNLLL